MYRFNIKTFNYLAKTLFLVIYLSCAPAKKQTYLYNAPLTNPAFEEVLSDYQIQPGDVLRIQVVSLTDAEFDIFKEENAAQNSRQIDPMLTGYLVDSNGYISLPFVGEVLVQRLTVREVREKLDTILSEYLESPVSNVRLISFHYTVIGEVQNQGKYDIYDDRLNIMEALGSAGGLTQFANYELVKILRTEEGVSTMYTINLLDANLPKSDYYYIRPNDVIIVDPLKNKNFRLNSSRNITLILSAVATSITLILAVDNLSN